MTNFIKFSINIKIFIFKVRNLFDRYNREINTIRISVTDRCNLKCFYCYDEYIPLNREDLISFEDIINIIKEGVKSGIKNVKITGGEPLLRKDIDKLIRMINNIGGIEDISITTNGVLLYDMAEKLKNSGLHRINVSMDTLNKEKYREITNGGDLDIVIKGIFKAKSLNFKKIKINSVFLKEINENEIEDIKEFAENNNFDFQLINQMNLKDDKIFSENIETNKPVDCKFCNRIRLTADGKLLPCLFSEKSINIKEYSSIKEAIKDCINLKPERGEKNKKFIMTQIGG